MGVMQLKEHARDPTHIFLLSSSQNFIKEVKTDRHTPTYILLGAKAVKAMGQFVRQQNMKPEKCSENQGEAIQTCFLFQDK